MKKFNKIVSLGSIGVAMVFTASCGGQHNGWSVSGTIAGAADSTLYIEEPSGPAWIIIDSVKVNKGDSFAYVADAPLYTGTQAIYRVRLNDKAVYFPVEGADAITVSASIQDMDMTHRVEGSSAAAGFNTVDSIVASAYAHEGDAAVNDPLLIQQLGDVILNDTTCVVAYYAIKKPIGTRPIFTLDEPRKIGLVGAAATKYSTLRPRDVRGDELAALHLNAKKMLRGGNDNSSVTASVAGRPDIEFVRTDSKGKEQNLNEVLDRGGISVVSLTRYDHPLSPANTAALGEVYETFRDKGLVIYQIDFEPNEAHWRQTATTLPWISVYNRPTDPVDILIAYNADPINGNPTSFVFDRNGELVARVSDPAELQKIVKGLF